MTGPKLQYSLLSAKAKERKDNEQVKRGLPPQAPQAHTETSIPPTAVEGVGMVRPAPPSDYRDLPSAKRTKYSGNTPESQAPNGSSDMPRSSSLSDLIGGVGRQQSLTFSPSLAGAGDGVGGGRGANSTSTSPMVSLPRNLSMASVNSTISNASEYTAFDEAIDGPLSPATQGIVGPSLAETTTVPIRRVRSLSDMYSNEVIRSLQQTAMNGKQLMPQGANIVQRSLADATSANTSNQASPILSTLSQSSTPTSSKAEDPAHASAPTTAPVSSVASTSNLNPASASTPFTNEKSDEADGGGQAAMVDDEVTGGMSSTTTNTTMRGASQATSGFAKASESSVIAAAHDDAGAATTGTAGEDAPQANSEGALGGTSVSAPASTNPPTAGDNGTLVSSAPPSSQDAGLVNAESPSTTTMSNATAASTSEAKPTEAKATAATSETRSAQGVGAEAAKMVKDEAKNPGVVAAVVASAGAKTNGKYVVIKGEGAEEVAECAVSRIPNSGSTTPVVRPQAAEQGARGAASSPDKAVAMSLGSSRIQGRREDARDMERASSTTGSKPRSRILSYDTLDMLVKAANKAYEQLEVERKQQLFHHSASMKHSSSYNSLLTARHQSRTMPDHVYSQSSHNVYPGMNGRDYAASRYSQLYPQQQRKGGLPSLAALPLASGTKPKSPRQRPVRPKVVESKGTLQCLGMNRKKKTRCRNAALMEYIGPRPLYCAEHIALDPKAQYHKCNYRLPDDSKGCKEIVYKDFERCYKHFHIWLDSEFTEPSDCVDKTLKLQGTVRKLLGQLESEASVAKREDPELYQRKSKLIPKYQSMDSSLKVHLNKVKALHQ